MLQLQNYIVTRTQCRETIGRVWHTLDGSTDLWKRRNSSGWICEIWDHWLYRLPC